MPDPRDPAADLRQIAFLMERAHEPTFKVKAFRTAAGVLDDLSADDVAARVEAGTLQKLTGIGKSTAQCIAESVHGQEPARLHKLAAIEDEPLDPAAAAVRAALRGDCHTHSDWSDGGSPIREMAQTARALGHEYYVLTDHSPRLTVANGLTAERLERQLDVVAELNDEFAAQAAAGTARRSASSPASRSTSSTTARWTRSRRCWPASTSSSPASIRSCGCRPRR